MLVLSSDCVYFVDVEICQNKLDHSKSPVKQGICVYRVKEWFENIVGRRDIDICIVLAVDENVIQGDYSNISIHALLTFSFKKQFDDFVKQLDSHICLLEFKNTFS